MTHYDVRQRYSGEDIKNIESVLNKELETQNHLRLNLLKTQYMVFGSHRKVTNCGDINLTVDSIHSHRTRNAVHNCVVVPLVRTQAGKKSLFPIVLP